MRCNKQTGDYYEKQALAYLIRHGLILIESNYHSRFGEIDLIMQDQEFLVFVEVRYRSTNQYGGPLASVTKAKQSKIIKCAQMYLVQQSHEHYCRFDLVCFNDQQPDWIKNAFSAR